MADRLYQRYRSAPRQPREGGNLSGCPAKRPLPHISRVEPGKIKRLPMDFVFVLFFIIVIALILVSRYSLSDKIERLHREVRRLREELKTTAPPVSAPPSAAPIQPQKEPEPYTP